MSRVDKLWIKGYVFALSEENYFYSIVLKRCDMQDNKISKCLISNIIDWKGNNSQMSLLHEKMTPNEYLEKVHTVSNLS